MRVTCIASTATDLPPSCWDADIGITPEVTFPLTIGATYVVYAITVFRGHCWYYVFDDNRLAYPVWKLAALFEVSEPSIPPDWIVGYVRQDHDDEGFPLISFPEWALDHYFYERLVEGDSSASKTFQARRTSAEQR
jgi:hypothetical protein